MSITISETPAQQIQPSAPRRFRLWPQAGLFGALVTAAALNISALDINGYSNEYYAAAVKSMTQSWSNFFFGAFDTSGFITVDKPAFAFWIEAAFAKVLGVNSWSILLPSAIAGVLSVALLYSMVKRYFGTVAATVAAFTLALTPISVVMNRDNNPDAMLTLAILAAGWATLKAASTGRLRWLALAGVLVGIGFNIKMLEAWVILPALAAVYFLCANTGWLKRIGHLAVFGIVVTVVSLSWAVAVDLTPASSRPYVGGSTGNSVLELALGYNGLGRITGNERGGTSGQTTDRQRTDGTTTTDGAAQTNGQAPAGALPGSGTPFTGAQGGPGGGAGGGFGGATGITRLVRQDMGGEASWLLPLAVIGFALAGWQTWRRFPQKQIRTRRFSALILFGGWLGTFFVVFSFAQGIFHNYYLVVFAPAVAALTGIAIDALWHSYRKGGLQSVFLPVAIAANAAYCVYLASAATNWQTWIVPTVIGICGGSALLLVGLRLFRRHTGSAPMVVVGIALIGLWLAPGAWSVNATQHAVSGSLVSAYPTGSTGGRGGLPGMGQLPAGIEIPADIQEMIEQGKLPTGGMPGMGGASVSSALIAHLEANNNGERYLVAVGSSQSAGGIILKSNIGVMTIGGFSGSDNSITLDEFKVLVANGQARYVLGGGNMGGPGGGSGSSASQISSWAASTCQVVDYSGTSSTGGTIQQAALYDCAEAVK